VNPDQLKRLLEAVAAGERSPDEALNDLAELPYADLGFAKLDFHRELRNGTSETRFSYRVIARRKDVAAERMPRVDVPRRHTPVDAKALVRKMGN